MQEQSTMIEEYQTGHASPTDIVEEARHPAPRVWPPDVIDMTPIGYVAAKELFEKINCDDRKELSASIEMANTRISELQEAPADNQPHAELDHLRGCRERSQQEVELYRARVIGRVKRMAIRTLSRLPKAAGRIFIDGDRDVTLKIQQPFRDMIGDEGHSTTHAVGPGDNRLFTIFLGNDTWLGGDQARMVAVFVHELSHVILDHFTLHTADSMSQEELDNEIEAWDLACKLGFLREVLLTLGELVQQDSMGETQIKAFKDFIAARQPEIPKRTTTAQKKTLADIQATLAKKHVTIIDSPLDQYRDSLWFRCETCGECWSPVQGIEDLPSDYWKCPRRCNDDFMKARGIQIVNLLPEIIQCDKCNETWSPLMDSGQPHPRGWWKCSNGCNHDDYTVLGLLKECPANGVFTCATCGETWNVAVREGLFPRGWWQCPQGCNHHLRSVRNARQRVRRDPMSTN